ncbi:MAG: cytidine deaminase [Steroidobacteraceae bacterium]
MTDNKDSLVAAARACCERSHAPYSGVHVCAAVRAASGAVYLGNNVENAAYPLGNCAETSAIAAGVQAEGAGFRIAEVAVWATDRDGRRLAASPCGGCRQRIRELAKDGEIEIHFPWREGEVRTVTLDDLLPFAFFLPAGPPGR